MEICFKRIKALTWRIFIVLPSAYYKGWGTGGSIIPQIVWDFLFWWAHALGRSCANSGDFLHRLCTSDDE
eukprot:8274807-Ditylum_brightwellii.AAC.1